MTSRAFAIVLAAVSGTPLVVAGLLSVCPSVRFAQALCLLLAAIGAFGAWYGARLLLPVSRTCGDTQTTDVGASPAGAISRKEPATIAANARRPGGAGQKTAGFQGVAPVSRPRTCV